MPTAADPASWAARLVRDGVAGPHQSHSHQNNMGKLRRTLEGDPDCTFGLSGLEGVTFEDALATMAAVAGWKPEQPTEYVDPERTIAGALEAGRFCRSLARLGAEAVVGTGHPDTLLVFLEGVVETLEEAGMVVRTDRAGSFVKAGFRPRALEYEGKVAVLSDDWGPVHTHSPLGMELLLESGPPPDLVVADHGWAGAAMEARIATVATLDTNDPALALGAGPRSLHVLIPLDDGRPPPAYIPVLEAFRAGFSE